MLSESPGLRDACDLGGFTCFQLEKTLTNMVDYVCYYCPQLATLSLRNTSGSVSCVCKMRIMFQEIKLIDRKSVV